MDNFKYIPGQTDIRSLPKDILILLLTQIESDTIKHFKEHDSELNELRFKIKYCNCGHRLVRCCEKQCEAMTILSDGYHDIHQNCTSMIRCKCGNRYCNKHLKCQSCGTCEKCTTHEKCKYCYDYICHKKQLFLLSFEQDFLGDCDNCGNSMTYIGKDYRCSRCCRYNQGYRVDEDNKYQKCNKCGEFDVHYLCKIYQCIECNVRNGTSSRSECKICNLTRHYECKNFGNCHGCKDELCPECNDMCSKCNTQLCTVCFEYHEC